MFHKSVAVIGTAGRNEDYAKLSKESFKRMCNGVIAIMNHFNIDKDSVELISGGAAWADHVVVDLVLSGIVPYKNLTIFTPTPFINSRYIGTNPKSITTANIANYHHDKFSVKLGYSSLEQISSVEERGSTIISGNGNFFSRNIKVAKSVSPNGILIAFTFGSETCRTELWKVSMYGSNVDAATAGLKPGGTAHTWNICKADRKCHIRLGGL